MWAILVAAGLATSVLAAYVPSDQTDNFFDSVLAETDHLISVNREEKLVAVDFNPFLDVSVNYGKVNVRGPTKMVRLGQTEGTQDVEMAYTTGLVSLGQLDYNVQGLELNLFGKTLTTDILFTIQDAVSPVSITVFRNNLASCQVSVHVEPPEGSHLIHFGSQGGPLKLLTAFFEYILALGLQYVRIPYFHVNNLFPDVTSHLERELTIAARRISC